jgi:alanyl-tRNA synthetase
MSVSGTLSGHAIRKLFVRYFEEKRGHKELPSASLVPTNPTVLLTPAGMLPFVPVFLGIEPPPTPPRIVTSQKCARVSGKASDLEYVGRTPRHHTFFEMLGNFSFGDYFKKEVIPWAWEFLTEDLKLPKERLWVSVYKTDFEARDIWRDVVGVPESRILFRDEKDNFWGPPGPTGPCGPCSEIYYDWGSLEDGDPQQDPDLLDTDRFMEIWNLVFMELFKDAEGNFTPLNKKNIDTGMGLERITMVVQGKQNTFETDLLYPIVNQVAKMAGIPYKHSEATDVALKIVADHIRMVTFSVADGITPSNEGRGYIIRMILRRAVRYGKKYLGFQQPFLYQLVTTVRDLYQDPYDALKTQYNHVVETVKLEEQRFLETLERGSRVLEEVMDELRASKKSVIPGEAVFKLYDTYGFPVELTADMAQEEGFTLDEPGFEAAMEAQRTRARSARKGEAIVEDQVYSRILETVGPSQFLGYETLSAEATVKALILNGESVDEVSGTNQPFEAILDQTPFYAESGGQIGDRGSFSREEGHHGLTVVVNDTVKVGELFVHKCLFDNGGSLRVGETLLAQVEPVARQRAVIHHTATHLLQSALKKVLGDGVTQAGSYVSPEGARFDFTFNRGLKPEEVQRVEYLINKWILENTPRHVEWLDLEAAKKAGAIAMFDEKYGDRVRVISFGETSKELCGGTHVDRLGEIGVVKILSESAIASGVRRIEMVAGEKAYKLFKQVESDLATSAALLKSPPREVPGKVEKLLEELKQRDKLIRELEEKLAGQEIQRLRDSVSAEYPVIIQQITGQSPDGLRLMAEKLGQFLPTHLVLLATAHQEKAHFICSVSQDWVKHGLNAGEIVKKAATLCGGGGGGRPHFAQAGGKDPSQIATALKAVSEEVTAKLAPQQSRS